MMFLEKFGDASLGGGRVAIRDRVWISAHATHFNVQFCKKGEKEFKPVWISGRGFVNRDWYVAYEVMQQALVLDRLADV